MRHVFDGPKIVYFEHSLPSATRRSNFTHTPARRVREVRTLGRRRQQVLEINNFPRQKHGAYTVKGFIVMFIVCE